MNGQSKTSTVENAEVRRNAPDDLGGEDVPGEDEGEPERRRESDVAGLEAGLFTRAGTSPADSQGEATHGADGAKQPQGAGAFVCPSPDRDEGKDRDASRR